MSDGVGRLRVQGAANLRRTLKAAAGSVQDLKDVHKDVADLVAGRARITAPVGPPPDHIRDTIRGAGTATAAIVRVGRARTPYGRPLHWGAPRRHIKAQPWIYDAAKDLSDRWVPMYLHRVEKIIDSVEGTTAP
jgi:hypothetical protein